MDKHITDRGFSKIEFDDLYGAHCSIQESSLATKAAIWIGIDKPKPIILAEGAGWVDYPLPEGVFIGTRMHIDQKQAEEIISVLQKFVDTGDL